MVAIGGNHLPVLHPIEKIAGSRFKSNELGLRIKLELCSSLRLKSDGLGFKMQLWITVME